MARTEQEIKLREVIVDWLEDDEQATKWREINKPTITQKLQYNRERSKRIDAFVEVFKTLLVGGSYQVFGKIIHERTTIDTTCVELDASSIMAIICGQIDRVTGFKPKATKPEKAQPYYTHS